MAQSSPAALPPDWLDRSLASASRARVAVFGDLCLDAYWHLDETRDDVSIETGLPVHTVAGTRYSPGGAGNVAANLRALGVPDVRLIGVVGADLFAAELLKQYHAHGLLTDQIEVAAEWQTWVYAKPYRGAAELNRLDFGGCAVVPHGLAERLIARVEAAAAEYPVVVINQQIEHLLTASLFSRLATLPKQYPSTCFLVDSRQYSGRFPGAALKLNRFEAARITRHSGDSLPEATELAQALAAQQSQPVLITRGEAGLVLAAGGELHEMPGIELPGEVDTVGAGDAALAGFAAALAAGLPSRHAAALANLAAAVTTRQVRTTGLARAEWLRAAGR